MFKKFARLEDRNDRLEIYNLLNFNLKACQRVAEFFLLAILASGLAWMISSPLTRSLGQIAGSALAIGLMLLMAALVRLPFLIALGTLQADFGLDPRPASIRLRAFFIVGARRWLTAWVLSVAAYQVLARCDLWLWSLVIFLVGFILTVLHAYFPGLFDPRSLRPLQPGELDPALLKRLDMWKVKTGLGSDQVVVSTSYDPYLTPPYLRGLGRTLKLVVPEKALAFFTPRELTLLGGATAMSGLVKTPLKFLFLRLCSLAVSVPLASILISTLGGGWWGYPLITSPALIVLIWAAFWLGHWLAELTSLLTWRGINTQLVAAASVLLKDESAVEATLGTLAEKNLEEDNPPAWREIFLVRHTKKAFLNRTKYHQHMSKFNG